MTNRPRPVRPTVLLLLVLVLGPTACSGQPTPGRPAAGKQAGLEGCTPDHLVTVRSGRLTLSTGVVTRAPWVVRDDGGAGSGDPRTGRGYDAAVGFALAERLGFEADEVTWVATPFAEVVAAGDKPFDVNVGQATITDERRDDVDLSTPYYAMRQAVVSISGRSAADATDLAGLRGVRFAVVRGTAAQQALRAAVGPDVLLTLHDDLDKARGGLSSGEQDALVVDFQTALQLDQDDSRLVDGELVGLLPRSQGQVEEFGLVLQKGSALTRCVDAALSAMRADGELEALEQEWLSRAPGFPELR